MNVRLDVGSGLKGRLLRAVAAFVMVVAVGVILVASRPARPPEPWAFVPEFAARHGLAGGVIVHGTGTEVPPAVLVFGMADAAIGRAVVAEDRFKIASLTKPVTAEVILRMADRGLIGLDRPLAEVFPQMLTATDRRLAEVTPRHLLLHRGGWDPGESFDPFFLTEAAFRTATGGGGGIATGCDGIAEGMLSQPLQSDPGARFAYSNLGYCWLGRLIARAGPGSLEMAIRQFVPELGTFSFDAGDVTVVPPFGGERLMVDDPQIIGAAGGMVTDALSYYRFAAAEKDARLHERPEGEDGPVYYAMGWRVRQMPQGLFLTHMGSMPGAFSIVIRDVEGPTIVALFNGLAAQPFHAFDDFLAAVLAQGFPQE